MEYVDLDWVIETCKHLCRNKYAFWSYCGLFRHLPQFATHALVYGSCASVSVACVASLLPPLAISLRSRRPLLSMWRRSSVAIKLRCGRAKNNVRQHKRVFISLDGMATFAGMGPEHCNYLPTSLPLGVHVSGLFRICWLSYKGEYFQSCCACKHLLWNIVFIRILTVVSFICILAEFFFLWWQA